jgi:hypothetical protein
VTYSRTTRAGFPATTTWSGTSCVTTDRAATMEPSPICTPGSTQAPNPTQQLRPSRIGRGRSSRNAGARRRRTRASGRERHLLADRLDRLVELSEIAHDEQQVAQTQRAGAHVRHSDQQYNGSADRERKRHQQAERRLAHDHAELPAHRARGAAEAALALVGFPTKRLHDAQCTEHLLDHGDSPSIEPGPAGESVRARSSSGGASAWVRRLDNGGRHGGSTMEVPAKGEPVMRVTATSPTVARKCRSSSGGYRSSGGGPLAKHVLNLMAGYLWARSRRCPLDRDVLPEADPVVD